MQFEGRAVARSAPGASAAAVTFSRIGNTHATPTAAAFRETAGARALRMAVSRAPGRYLDSGRVYAPVTRWGGAAAPGARAAASAAATVRTVTAQASATEDTDFLEAAYAMLRNVGADAVDVGGTEARFSEQFWRSLHAIEARQGVPLTPRPSPRERSVPQTVQPLGLEPAEGTLPCGGAQAPMMHGMPAPAGTGPVRVRPATTAPSLASTIPEAMRPQDNFDADGPLGSVGGYANHARFGTREFTHQRSTLGPAIMHARRATQERLTGRAVERVPHADALGPIKASDAWLQANGFRYTGFADGWRTTARPAAPPVYATEGY
jgi:hypothetical protein